MPYQGLCGSPSVVIEDILPALPGVQYFQIMNTKRRLAYRYNGLDPVRRPCADRWWWCQPESVVNTVILNNIEYIGVDGSPERGKKNETTIEYAIEFLTSKGFEVIKSNINQRYAKALFKNPNFKYK